MKVSYIAIPRELIYDKKIKFKAKYLYIILKMSNNKDKVNIGYENLMTKLRWKDKETLRKYINQLNDNDYINLKGDKIGKYNPIECTIKFTKPFIQLDRTLINKILDLEDTPYEKGLLLMYILEDKYNDYFGYSCPNVRDITSVLSFKHNQLKELMKIYHENYICEFSQGKKIGEGYTRTRNRYIPNKKDTSGKNRYIKHKRPEYFE